MTYRTFTLKANQEIQVPVQGKVILVDDTGAAEGIDITPMRANSEMPTMPKRQKAFKCFVDYDAIKLKAADDCTISLFLSQTDVSLGFANGAQVNVLGQVSIINDPDNRIPVDIGGGAITVTADNVGVSNTDANPVPVRQGAADVFAVGVKNDDAAAIPVRQRAADVFAVAVSNDDAAALPVRQRAADVYKVAQKLLTEIIELPPVNVGVARVALVSDADLQRVRVRNSHAEARVAIGGEAVTMENAAVVLEPGDVWNETDAPGASWFAVSDMAGAVVKLQGLK